MGIKFSVLLKRLGYDSYQQYLRSDLWKGIRAAVLPRCGGVCCCCKVRQATTVHHGSYRTSVMVGHEPKCLIPLCWKCHEAAEFLPDGTKATLDQANFRLQKMKEHFRQHPPHQWEAKPICHRCKRGKGN